MQTPFFITFEGGEGSGKTTNIERLFNHLKEAGMDCIKTREPGGTELGNELREILLNSKTQISQMAELLMMQAARAQNVAEVIVPALEAGRIVICDRYIDSTFAYQGFGRKIPLDSIEDSSRIATNGLMPDLTIYLDLDPQVGMDRARSRNELDRIEKEKMEFHYDVRKGFITSSQKDKDRFAVIDASQEIDKVFADVVEAVESAIQRKVKRTRQAENTPSPTM